jgi:hypothetical protein
MSMVALNGSLDAFKLPDVLTFLNSAKKTGMLTVANEGREAYVFCRSGAVVYAASNQEQLRLAALLLRKRHISKQQADVIDELMLKRGGRFGDLAVTQGLLTDGQLDEYLKIQVSEVLYDSFLWKSGTFMFYDGFDLPPDAVTIAVDLTNLIMEGARRIEQWEQCLQLLPNSMAVFRVIPRPESEKITLTADEWKVLFLINGQRSLDDLCRDSTEDTLAVYRVVYGLSANKLIEEVSPATDAGMTLYVPGVSAPDDEERADEGDVEDTFIDKGSHDDTNLVTSSEARLAYKDVVRTTVGQLAVLTGDLEGTVYLLTDSEYTIGRQVDNTFQIADLGVSGHHARIFRGPDGYVLEDLKSRNGTWLNGTRVYHAVLQSNDQIRIGSTDLKYEVLYDDGPTRPGV